MAGDRWPFGDTSQGIGLWRQPNPPSHSSRDRWSCRSAVQSRRRELHNQASRRTAGSQRLIESAMAAPTQPSARGLRGVRALVVEDTWHVGEALRHMLEDLGLEVAGPAASVSEAERLIAQSPPAVAFIDIQLRNGELAYGLIEALHERGIRIIVTSAFAVLSERVEKRIKFAKNDRW